MPSGGVRPLSCSEGGRTNWKPQTPVRQSNPRRPRMVSLPRHPGMVIRNSGRSRISRATEHLGFANRPLISRHACTCCKKCTNQPAGIRSAMSPPVHTASMKRVREPEPSIAAKASPSRRTLRGLDWLNFFLADVQTGVGPFLAIYLAGYGWNEQRVGLALTVGGIAGILTQTPAGALVDRLRSKRALITTGIVALAAGALLIALVPTFWSVMSAQVLIGGTSSIFGPAICAISLGIVGHQLFDRRQGRNQAFNSAGNVVAAVSMGLCGHFISNRSIFFFVSVCALPTILTLLIIRPDEIDYERARRPRGKKRTARKAAKRKASGCSSGIADWSSSWSAR